jgi:hypothetical protein
VRLDDGRALRDRRGWDIGETSTNVEYDHESEPRRLDITVNLPDGLTQDQIERLQRVADTCPVGRALEAGFSFDEHISFPAQDRATTNAPDA